MHIGTVLDASMPFTIQVLKNVDVEETRSAGMITNYLCDLILFPLNSSPWINLH